MKSEYASVVGFLVLVFVLSTPFWVLGHVCPVQLLPGLPISALVVFAPALAAVIMACRGGQLPAVRHLLQRSLDFDRIGNRYWYLLFVFFNPAIAILVYWVVRATGGSLGQPASVTFAVVPLFALFFVGGLAEEIGWTGYATGPLQRRWGTLATGVLLGLAWVAFHLVVLQQANRSLEWIAWWSLGTISLRTLMVWLYDHAGKSVFAAAMFHAMINLSWQLFPVNGSFYDPRLFGLAVLFSTIVIFAAGRLVSSGRMSVA